MSSASLVIQSLSFTLPSGRTLIHDLDLTIQSGECVVLTGENGSGKSTLMKLLQRHYLPTKGQILLNGKALKRLSPKALAKEVIFLNQSTRDSLFLDLTVFENARLIANIKNRVALKKHLSSFNPKLAKALEQTVSDLSGGEQQQLAFALYLMHRPTLLLLDEHTSALDPKTAEKVMEMTMDYLKTHRITCLMTLHHPEFAKRFGDRHCVMKDGHLE